MEAGDWLRRLKSSAAAQVRVQIGFFCPVVGETTLADYWGVLQQQSREFDGFALCGRRTLKAELRFVD